MLRVANEIRWFTFAGNILNLAIADALRQHGYNDIKVSDFWIRVGGTTDHERLSREIDHFTPEAVKDAFRVPKEYLDQLKFGECLPQRTAEEMIKDRLLPLHLLQSVLGMGKKAIIC